VQTIGSTGVLYADHGAPRSATPAAASADVPFAVTRSVSDAWDDLETSGIA